jgi:uncharacterized protein (DUF433 family)
MAQIVRSDGILGGGPRVAGTRVGVLHVYDLAVDGEHSPADVADQLDLSLGEVYSALAYYHENPDEMRAVRRARDEAAHRLREEALTPPEPAR